MRLAANLFFALTFALLMFAQQHQIGPCNTGHGNQVCQGSGPSIPSCNDAQGRGGCIGPHGYQRQEDSPQGQWEVHRQSQDPSWRPSRHPQGTSGPH